ncbi:MAG: hypothetical protein K9N34_08250 [Candidatus Marinimicrobia bacterium]|nr:hypothetical protein [Candidatus Neomarinimicrobiota bacterium]MCF7840686.1 hypothetical protein [Candidatus Neomarinimicrobiota bacterium]MCF7902303.1 hypothetical protein [Candidatus Neomarinimicrobiota bacterium]
MAKYHRKQRGSVLVMAMIYFVIFSLAGMAALSLAAHFRLESVKSKQAKTFDLKIESVLNEALFRLNAGPDSLANFTRDGVTSAFDDNSQTITISGYGKTLTVTLEDMHPFNHGVAFRDDIDTSSYSVTLLEGHGIRQFPFLPEVVTSYYMSNAVAVYNANTAFDSVMTPGIHFATKNVFLKQGAYLEGTLVVMGKLKVVGTEVTLQAVPDSNGIYLPALIVADSTADISTTPGIIIRGPIYSSGPFDMKGGTLTGPLVGVDITLSQKLDINDLSNEKYYKYPPGFGDVTAYDWPKRILKNSWSMDL